MPDDVTNVQSEAEAPKKILLIDDDDDEAFLFGEALKDTGLSANYKRIRNVGEIDAFPNPDIIFLDLNMPYKDGIETLPEIKANENLVAIPLIIYSTSKSKASINASYEGGATRYFVKAHEYDETVCKLKEVCSTDWDTEKRCGKEEFVI